MEQTYYEKIMLISGEVPEKDGDYNTDDGIWKFDTSVGLFTMQKEDDKLYCAYKVKLSHFKWWFKPVPSPQQEAVLFHEWMSDGRWIKSPKAYKYFSLNDEECIYYSISELYDKFKSEKDDRLEKLEEKVNITH